MSERPIIFSAMMVQALLDGRKTQTRRLAPTSLSRCDHGRHNPGTPHEGPWSARDGWHCATCGAGDRLTRGGTRGERAAAEPGDVFWVRETCRAEELSRPETKRPATARERQALGRTEVIVLDELDGADGVRYIADDAWLKIENTPAAGEAWHALFYYRGRGKGRIGNVVPGIHMPKWVSRIRLPVLNVRVERLETLTEADAIAEGVYPAAVYGGKVESWLPAPDMRETFYPTARQAYVALWEHLHGAESWATNPLVWVYTFGAAEVRS